MSEDRRPSSRRSSHQIAPPRLLLGHPNGTRTRGHGTGALHARAITNARLASAVTTHLLVASCETGGVVDPSVVVMVGPKHPLSFGGVYEQPRAARWIHGPAFARREVSRPRSG